ncbi:MAG: tRNA (adenosine(37)-N6)-threonylcarbamoyltransferase complex dimerization subunit type 1 TsaB [Tannerellaceae bacterium]|jgi:tRNA threonylcarbamoyladenosine biosynthesis protein TsaB|nr:tRNA (adenosine(37)-N6)-threonylcarbamoyltransferase complex dimerization subunit type 1 TsaB [Tannerellaceae bacterium]
MSCLLHIETSTTVCSVALSLDGESFFERASFDGPSHAALSGVYVEEALALLRCRDMKPDAIAVSSGPGSYTGLRIGVSLAKGLCFGYDIPLISVPTLEIIAYRTIGQTSPASPGALYCAMLDARRMEVYAAIFDARRRSVRGTAAEIIDAGAYASFLAGHTVYFSGSGAAKCRDVIASANAVFVDGIHPLAADMAPLAEKLFNDGSFEDTAYFEPFYLKEFIATTPGNKVFTHTKNHC